jgi:hypothetical protein
MGKKARLKVIKKLANNLPLINQVSTEPHLLSGAEILEWGTITEIDGKPIDPEKKYLHHYPVLMVQNNRRGMKRAFLRNGVEGVKQFLGNISKTVENHFQS